MLSSGPRQAALGAAGGTFARRRGSSKRPGWWTDHHRTLALLPAAAPGFAVRSVWLQAGRLSGCLASVAALCLTEPSVAVGSRASGICGAPEAVGGAADWLRAELRPVGPVGRRAPAWSVVPGGPSLEPAKVVTEDGREPQEGRGPGRGQGRALLLPPPRPPHLRRLPDSCLSGLGKEQMQPGGTARSRTPGSGGGAAMAKGE